ncbi:hypothetical protein [Methylocapsa palsarum]|uniref:Uncharacterized protein n=1 Tax=Methylocapsa palsarum TaxID=1612308 RepID=A0A1I3WBA7_9HYPH|nr:hypothetical protein [Methylocapsa palsarum]SFK04027.1 hypothetical protein SAMN05444581_101438 [Methylocapsa palsarum]
MNGSRSEVLDGIRLRVTQRRVFSPGAANLIWAAILMSTASVFLTGAARPVRAQDKIERTGGVRILNPGDEMTPIGAWPDLARERDSLKLDKIHVAVADGEAKALAGVSPRAAPFEIVPVSANPDLVWNASSRDVSAGGATIASNVAASDLPAVIDRTAAARALAALAATRPQQMRFISGSPTARKGQNVDIEIEDMLNRGLVLFAVTGDGSVRALYPLTSDQKIVETPALKWSLRAREPLGADLIVAVTSARPMEALAEGLKQISNHRSAGEVLKVLALAPADARVGTLSLSTSP